MQKFQWWKFNHNSCINYYKVLNGYLNMKVEFNTLVVNW